MPICFHYPYLVCTVFGMPSVDLFFSLTVSLLMVTNQLPDLDSTTQEKHSEEYSNGDLVYTFAMSIRVALFVPCLQHIVSTLS